MVLYMNDNVLINKKPTPKPPSFIRFTAWLSLRVMVYKCEYHNNGNIYSVYSNNILILCYCNM